jgi:hypothetical protein
MSLQFYWGGPHRNLADPRWGGPHGSSERSLADTDPLFVYALRTLGQDLVADTLKKRDLVQSPTSESTWDGTKPTPLQLETDDVPSEAQLQQYIPSVRSDIIKRELLSGISVSADANTARLSMTVGARDIATLHTPGVSRFTTELDAVKDGIKKKYPEERVPELWAHAQNVLAFLTAPLGITASTHPFTSELIHVATGVLGAVLHTTKHRFAIARPYANDPTLVPTAPLPGHLSFPGGHSAYGHFCVELLVALATSKSSRHPGGSKVAEPLARMVELIADGRVIAGLHYPIDAHAGEVLGKAFASWLLGAGSKGFGSATWTPMTFKDNGSGKKMQRAYGAVATAAADLPSWRWLMHRAALEW